MSLISTAADRSQGFLGPHTPFEWDVVAALNSLNNFPLSSSTKSFAKHNIGPDNILIKAKFLMLAHGHGLVQGFLHLVLTVNDSQSGLGSPTASPTLVKPMMYSPTDESLLAAGYVRMTLLQKRMLGLRNVGAFSRVDVPLMSSNEVQSSGTTEDSLVRSILALIPPIYDPVNAANLV